MRKPTTLSMAEYRSGLASSLYETILDKANKECSPQLYDLITLACDINQEIHESLAAPTQSTTQEAPKADNSVFEITTEAENALMASKQAQAVLALWLNSIPGGEECEEESHRVVAVMSLMDNTITQLNKAIEAGTPRPTSPGA